MNIPHVFKPGLPPIAYVQMSTPAEALRALNSPEPVLGNRFVQVKWAQRDVAPADFEGGARGAGGRAPPPPPPGMPGRARGTPQRAGEGESAAAAAEIARMAQARVARSPSCAPRFASVEAPARRRPDPRRSPAVFGAPGSQEAKERHAAAEAKLKQKRELEELAAAARAKEEELHRQIEQQRLLLERLHKRSSAAAEAGAAGAGVGAGSEGGGGGGAAAAQALVGQASATKAAVAGAADSAAQSAAELRAKYESLLQKRAGGSGGAGGLKRPASGGGLFPGEGGAPANPAEKRARFKLDNRPYGVRVAGPVPAGIGVSELRDHFSYFGAVSWGGSERLFCAPLTRSGGRDSCC